MQNVVAQWMLVCGMLALSACNVAPAHSTSSEEVSAVIVEPTERSRASLRDVVSKALARESVLLSSDALTSDDTLTIEPARVRDAAGQLMTDSSVRVERFRLVKQGDSCALVHERTGQRYALSNTKCVPK